MSKENKLTIEDAMKYPKAKVRDYLGEVAGQGFKDVPNILEFITANCNTFSKLDGRTSSCKLILRSIESLTGKEKDELNMIYRKHSLRPLASDKQYDDIRFYTVLIDYLRSISVDIDGLEKQGVAVYESEGK